MSTGPNWHSDDDHPAAVAPFASTGRRKLKEEASGQTKSKKPRQKKIRFKLKKELAKMEREKMVKAQIEKNKKDLLPQASTRKKEPRTGCGFQMDELTDTVSRGRC